MLRKAIKSPFNMVHRRHSWQTYTNHNWYCFGSKTFNSHETNWHDDNNITSVTNPTDSCTGFSRAYPSPYLTGRGALSTGARRSGREAHNLTPSCIEAKNALIVQFGATDTHSGDTRFDLHCLKKDFTLLYTKQITLPNSVIKYDEYEPLTAIHWNKRRGTPLTTNWNSGERCAACRHAKRSLKWSMVLAR